MYILFCCVNVAIVFLAVNPQGTENVFQASGVYRLVTLHGQNIQDGAFCRAHITDILPWNLSFCKYGWEIWTAREINCNSTPVCCITIVHAWLSLGLTFNELTFVQIIIQCTQPYTWIVLVESHVRQEGSPFSMAFYR